jgi:triphosphoribosyl-dephospho-CoA synthase
MTPTETVAVAAELACMLEVSAHKPGNVTPTADFADTQYIDFLISAAAVGHVLRKAARMTTGMLVLEMVRETRTLVPRNTNLGIALLFAPLARAALLGGRRTLRSRLRTVLRSVQPNDGRRIYEAIRVAAPGGLGEAEAYDVRTTRGIVPLRAAMRAAMERDSIAREYVTDFEITFGIGAPTLEGWVGDSGNRELSIIQTYLTILSRIPDSLVVRKCGWREAKSVSQQAKSILAMGGAATARGRRRLRPWDLALRRGGNRLNPGTTADLTAAALFVVLLERGAGFVLGARSG